MTEDRVVLISGAGGAVGSALVGALGADWTVVGLDLDPDECACEAYRADLTDPESITAALQTVRERHGDRLAAVIHLAAYFDFTGEDHPLYDKLNVEGSRHLMRALQWMTVERVIYAGTMLVHRPCRPGAHIDETAPIEPKWAYPISKAKAEAAILEETGNIPVTLLHLAGLYDDAGAVPTLTHQIARIYERRPKSRFYSGDLEAGQAMVHQDDMVDAMRRAVERRAELPDGEAILVGEPEAMGYQALQDEIGRLIHGSAKWETAVVPEPYAKAGAWLEAKSEPVVPDDFDYGEKPFIRPFMIDMAADHYALDISKAKRLLGWAPRRTIAETLPRMIEALKADPRGWYQANGITPPRWMEVADKRDGDPEAMRVAHERRMRDQHQRHLWGHFANIGLGFWLMTSGPTLGYESAALLWSDFISGAVVTALAMLCLSWKFAVVRWAVALVGLWLLTAPLIFWAPTAAAYLNDTLVGALVIGFSVLVRPPPGLERSAAELGPDVPPGWDFSPSSWLQRAPIIALAVVGFFISRYLCAYQLGHIDAAWEPFFLGSAADPQNGTEEIITSSVSEAFPVPDAGLGALTYMIEILTGMLGSIRRWRTMPWLVILFGVLIVPLGGVSIGFIIIQPIVIGTWSTLTLIAAAAMLIQIPYSVDELVATIQFLIRRWRAGAPILRVFLRGDVDDAEPARDADDFERPGWDIVKDAAAGGVNMPWPHVLVLLIGAWLMFTRITLGAEGWMANADHLVGAIAITVTITAAAEPLRSFRLANLPLGAALFVTPFVFEASLVQIAASLIAGAALIVLSLPRGLIQNRWGGWERRIV